jgi:hypothetical protein
MEAVSSPDPMRTMVPFADMLMNTLRECVVGLRLKENSRCLG